MRAAIYARVACANQLSKHAIVSQLETLRDYSASHGLEIIEEFTDEGYSGLRLDRPGLDRMRGLAGHRGFDVLLTCGPDRLARSFALQVLIAEEMERCGIRTIFLDRVPADEPQSRLCEITGAVADLEQAKPTERDHGAFGGEIVTAELAFGYGRISGHDGTAAQVKIWGSEAVIVPKSFDARSCLPGGEANNSVDGTSRGSGQSDLRPSTQGVE